MKRKLKLKVIKAACKCGSSHAIWWNTTPPPGCKGVVGG